MHAKLQKISSNVVPHLTSYAEKIKRRDFCVSF